MSSKRELEQLIREQRRAVLLVNMLSRRGRRLGNRARLLFEAEGWTFSDVFMIGRKGDLAGAIQRALDSRPTLLVVGSGDGTLSRIAALLAYQDTVLGVLPFGTTNNFARGLGIPLALDGAVDAIVRGKVADVDLGLIGDRYFANMVGIGISADIAAAVSPQLKRRLGRLAYAVTGMSQLFRHRAFTASIESDGQSLQLRTRQVVIANGAFHAGTPIGGDVTIDDRLLAVFWFGNSNRGRLVGDVVAFILRRGRARRRTNVRLTDRARIVTDRQLEVELDGELVGTTPMEISIAPQALKVMVPRALVDG